MPEMGDNRRKWTGDDYAWFCTCTDTHHDGLGECDKCHRVPATIISSTPSRSQ